MYVLKYICIYYFCTILCLKIVQLWQEVPAGLLRSLLEQLYELVSDSNEKRNNLLILRNMEMVRKMVNFLPIVFNSSTPSTTEMLFSLLGALLAKHPLTEDLLW